MKICVVKLLYDLVVEYQDCKPVVRFLQSSSHLGPAAFSRDTLLNTRWLLGGVPRGAEGIWRDLLEMSAGKQHVFIQRVLFIYEITKKRAGKAQILRLPNSQWEEEADIACVAGSVLEKMTSHRDPQNLQIFPNDVIKSTLTRFIEGWLGQKY